MGEYNSCYYPDVDRGCMPPWQTKRHLMHEIFGMPNPTGALQAVVDMLNSYVADAAARARKGEPAADDPANAVELARDPLEVIEIRESNDDKDGYVRIVGSPFPGGAWIHYLGDMTIASWVWGVLMNHIPV